MKDLKFKPVIVSFLVVVLLLAAGSLGYRYIAQEKPLQEQLASMQYSQITLPLKKQDGKYNISMQVEENYKLQQAFNELKEVMAKQKLNETDYTLSLVHNDTESAELKAIWQKQLFAIAEIMANGQYSKLPELMQLIEQQNEGVEAIADMDEQYVYITLLKDGLRLDQLLPLDGGKMEVWNNAK